MTSTRYSAWAPRTEWEGRDVFYFFFNRSDFHQYLTSRFRKNGKLLVFRSFKEKRRTIYQQQQKNLLLSFKGSLLFAVRVNWLWWKHPRGSHGHCHRITHPDIRTDIKASAKLHTHWTTSSPLSPVQFCLEFFTSLWKVDHDLALSLELQGCIRSFIQPPLMRS